MTLKNKKEIIEQEYKMIKCPFFSGNCWNTQVEKCIKYNGNDKVKQCLQH